MLAMKEEMQGADARDARSTSWSFDSTEAKIGGFRSTPSFAG
jgi:hypothetical protein